MRKTVFVVDDSNVALVNIDKVLGEHYNVLTFPSGADLFRVIETVLPDLILLDIEMPGMDGFEVLTKLKADKNYRDIPVVFLTGTTDEATEVRGFEMGVMDFIHKPFSAPVLVNRVKHQISVNDLIKERTNKLEQAYHNVIFILSDLVENRDKDTGGHIERTVKYIRILITEMFKQGIYLESIKNWDVEMVSSCAILHDIGKIGIPDVVLNKQGRLTTDEFEKVKFHTINGARIIDKVIARTGGDPFLHSSKLFAEYHHENWDGTGYPYGLKGEDIPLHGRVMAIADVYDALVTERPYKKAFPHEEAVEIILDNSGKRFDPKIVEVFYSVKDTFKLIGESSAGDGL